MSAPVNPPESFLEALRLQFDGRFRLRWSEGTSQWHLEQKVGRGRPPHKKVSPLDDRAIRWKDGFEFLLAVTPGDRTRCPSCQMVTKVPVLKMQYAKCEWCEKEFRACYWPLGEALLQHLRYLDPDRGGAERVLRDVEDAEYLQEFRRKRRVREEAKDAVWDDWRTLFNIPSVGYTGKEFH